MHNFLLFSVVLLLLFFRVCMSIVFFSRVCLATDAHRTHFELPVAAPDRQAITAIYERANARDMDMMVSMMGAWF